MISSKELIYETLAFRSVPRVPHMIEFTVPAKQKLLSCSDGKEMFCRLDNDIVMSRVTKHEFGLERECLYWPHGGFPFSILQPEETGYEANQIRDNESDREEYHLEGIGLYGQMISLFSECIIADKEPVCGFANARHSVQVVNAIYKASKEKKVVMICPQI